MRVPILSKSFVPEQARFLRRSINNQEQTCIFFQSSISIFLFTISDITFDRTYHFVEGIELMKKHIHTLYKKGDFT